ncbi:MAG TPA: hypothetical protein VL754_00855, partial [Verrucomicrobiae bacterium]|nr:hypothetical protein [Verrucomicrobiae bacterium]
MPPEIVQLDLRGMPAEKQAAALRERYAALRGQGARVTARVEKHPARLYISMLESGYRVALRESKDGTFIDLHPDGSTARLARGGAHSVVAHRGGRVYANTTENRVAVLDASTRQVLKHIAVGRNPSHLELSHDQRRLYVANSGSDEISIIDTATDTVTATAPTGRRP